MIVLFPFGNLVGCLERRAEAEAACNGYKAGDGLRDYIGRKNPEGTRLQTGQQGVLLERGIKLTTRSMTFGQRVQPTCQTMSVSKTRRN